MEILSEIRRSWRGEMTRTSNERHSACCELVSMVQRISMQAGAGLADRPKVLRRKHTVSCKLLIPNTFTACGEGGNYCSSKCYLQVKLAIILHEHGVKAVLTSLIDLTVGEEKYASLLRSNLTLALETYEKRYNQCAGCVADRPIDANGNHRMGDGEYEDLMRCQKDKYDTRETE
jgi:hypothetical protein